MEITSPTASAGVTAPTSDNTQDWGPLSPSDFINYDIVRDYGLKFWELRESGKYLEFAVRFVKTPLPVAGESFVGAFSQTLKDKLRATFLELKSQREAYGLTDEHVANIDYWLAHDMKERSVWWEAQAEAEFERPSESTAMNGYALDEARARPSATTFGSVKFKIPYGQWRWYNKADAKVSPQHEIYDYEENGVATRDNRTSLFYEGKAETKVEKDEANWFSVTASDKGYLNPSPDSLRNAFEANASLELGTFVRRKKDERTSAGNPLTGSLRGGYKNEDYDPSAIAGVPTTDHESASASGNAKYQWGTSGVNVNAAYSDVHNVTSYETKDANVVNGTAVYLTKRGIATIEAGVNGEREEYATSLTGLSGVEGNARGTAKVQLNLPKNFTLALSAAGGAVRSDGSLEGWYGELQNASARLEYGLGRKTAGGGYQSLGNLSLSLSGNFYDRTLAYMGNDVMAPGPVDQNQIGLSIGPGVMLVPTDWFKFEAGGYYSRTDQGGFLPVDSAWTGADGKASLQLSKRDAKLSTWLYVYGGWGRYTLTSDDLRYETEWPYASVNLNVKNF